MTLGPSARKSVHQFSIVDALLVGLYDGAFSVQEVAEAGSFGLGCAEALDGELVVIDGDFFLCRADGTVTRLAADEQLPFAEVVAFEPPFTLELDGPLSRAEVEAAIEAVTPSGNYFYGIRLDGEFESVSVREAQRQSKPYRPLSEAVASQHENVIRESSGTLLGFRAPKLFQGITVAGYHLHYIDDAREAGGHSLDYVLRRGTLRIEEFAGLDLRLPVGDDYGRADLVDPAAASTIRRVE